MESTSPLDSDFSSELKITGEMKDFLKETAKWAKFLSIVGFVFLGFMVLMGLFMGTFMSMFMDNMPESADMPIPMAAYTSIMSGVYIVLSVIMFFPYYYQFQFANKAQNAIRNNDQMAMTESFSFLKSNYKFWGILMAIYVGFIVIFTIIPLLFAGLFSAF